MEEGDDKTFNSAFRPVHKKASSTTSKANTTAPRVAPYPRSFPAEPNMDGTNPSTQAKAAEAQASLRASGPSMADMLRDTPSSPFAVESAQHPATTKTDNSLSGPSIPDSYTTSVEVETLGPAASAGFTFSQAFHRPVSSAQFMLMPTGPMAMLPAGPLSSPLPHIVTASLPATISPGSIAAAPGLQPILQPILAEPATLVPLASQRTQSSLGGAGSPSYNAPSPRAALQEGAAAHPGVLYVNVMNDSSKTGFGPVPTPHDYAEVVEAGDRMTSASHALRQRRAVRPSPSSDSDSDDEFPRKMLKNQYISVPEPEPTIVSSFKPVVQPMATAAAFASSRQASMNPAALSTVGNAQAVLGVASSPRAQVSSEPPQVQQAAQHPSMVQYVPVMNSTSNAGSGRGEGNIIASLPSGPPPQPSLPGSAAISQQTSAQLPPGQAQQAGSTSSLSAKMMAALLPPHLVHMLGSERLAAGQPSGVLPTDAAGLAQQLLLQEKLQAVTSEGQPSNDQSARQQAWMHGDRLTRGTLVSHDKPLTPQKEAPQLEVIYENLEVINDLAMFPTEQKKDVEHKHNDGEEDEDDEGALDVDQHLPWYRRPNVVTFFVSTTLGLILFTIGILLHIFIDFEKAGTVEVFRWLYFFAAWPPLWYITRFLVGQVFQLLEWWYFREALYYLTSLQQGASWLLFFIATLPWFNVIFRWLWCKSSCKYPGYRQATDIIWSICLCLMLFALANFLKAILAKLMSTSFYRTAHFKKIKDALQKEFYLQALSRPRADVVAEREERLREEALAQAEKERKANKKGQWLSSVLRRRHKQSAHSKQDMQKEDKLGPQATSIDAIKVDIPSCTAVEANLSASAQTLPKASGSPAATGQAMGSGKTVLANGLAAIAVPSNSTANALPAKQTSGTAEMQSLLSSNLNRFNSAHGSGSKLALSRHASQESLGHASNRSKKTKMSVADSQKARDATSKLQAKIDLPSEVIQAVGHPAIADSKDVSKLSDKEMERVRTSIVIKTYSALIRKHANMNAEHEAKELKAMKRFGKALFFNVRSDPGRDYLTVEDFEIFFEDKETAQKAYKVFDGDADGFVTRKEVKETAVAIYKERHNMALGLKDTDSIVSSLEAGVGMCIHFVFLAFYLLVFGIDILAGFSTFSATVLALTFVFGNSVKNMFESMLFLFVEHPYDVGDCIFMNNEMMRVKKISLLYTEMVKWNGERTYWPNPDLFNKAIVNWTRSKTKAEVVKLLVDIGVPWEVKQDIEDALIAHAAEKAGEFDGPPCCLFVGMDNPMKMFMVIAWTYNFAPDEFGRLVPARNSMFHVLQMKLKEHGLVHTLREVHELDKWRGDYGMTMPSTAAANMGLFKPHID